MTTKERELLPLKGIRIDGYSMCGIPPCDPRLLIRGTRYTAIPVVSVEGVHDVYLAQGNMNGDRFSKFIQECVIPLSSVVTVITPTFIQPC